MKKFKIHGMRAYPEGDASSILLNFRLGSKCLRLTSITVAALIVFSLLFSAYFILRDSLSPSTILQTLNPRPAIPAPPVSRLEDDIVHTSFEDKMFGLLPSGFDHHTCLSRHQAAFYQRPLQHRPYPYLLSRLRGYEALHRRCGPKTEPYKRAALHLMSGHTPPSSPCNYLVWVSFSGLGNQILTLASAFLYALLTGRVLLVDPAPTLDTADLFCEPFPNTSWLLPPEFPLIRHLSTLGPTSPSRFGRILADRGGVNLSFVYLHLAHDYDHHDKLFFCDEQQVSLRPVPWLVMKTDNYFVPSLFLMPSFQTELSRLFPTKASVFHLIGRYLFHPTNPVWGLITRYHRAYLAQADRRVGIQIRVFEANPGPYQHVLDQVMRCVLKEEVLPGVDPVGPITRSGRTTAVLLTSLSSGYLEKVREMYWEKGTTTGEVIGVHQPSQEEHQRKGDRSHGRKAWAEMYLLSLTDEMVMSAWSTFGHVGQGLGGIRPWILYKPENHTVPDPPCVRAVSIEPCFHSPPFYNCAAKRGVDTGLILPHVRHCEDIPWGLKLVNM